MEIQVSQRQFPSRLALFASALCLAALPTQTVFAQVSAKTSIISLVPGKSTPSEAGADKGEASFANPPANFHAFASVHEGEAADIEKLTLEFAAATKLTKVESTKDFKIEQGTSCVAGRSFEKGDTCALLVRFTPQGAGRRLGKIAITHTASAETTNLGLGGYGYSPVVSFTPALVSLVTPTYVSGNGLLSGARYLAVDGGDTLWIADTGNGVMRSLNSSGTLTTLASGYSGLQGVAVDNFGEAYFDVPSTSIMYEIFDYGPVVRISGTGTTTCTASAPCNLTAEALATPGEMSIDPYNHLFFADLHSGAAISTVQPLPANLIFLYDPFPYQTNPSSAMAADASDNLYSYWSDGSVCELVQSSLYNAENTNVIFNKVAGGHTCGYAGDGGLAGNAEIGPSIGQITFDLAGNLYFSDTNNQRVRRIDATTGTITTIAGNGVAGSSGNGGPATSLHLSSPTGVGVDSQGQVYIISELLSTPSTPQVVWKLGPNGMLSFASTVKGTSSAAQTVTVSNTGNSAMTLTNVVINGADPADFAIDTNTTSCLLTAGSTLAAGQSCKIGIIFKPSATGSRTANLVMHNNTVTNSNTVQLVGTGALTATTFTITAPPGGSVAPGTSMTFKASVTSSNSPAPTGKVTFLLDGAAISGSPVTVASGAAAITFSSSSVGVHTLTATYSGDANYAPAGPATASFTVAGQKQAVMTTPAPGSTLTGSTVTFTWALGDASATSYAVWVGTTGVGSHNIIEGGLHNSSSYTVSGIPTTGARVYVRLYTNFNGTLAYTDYTYTEK